MSYPNIGVVYLARGVDDGLGSAKAFLDSYRRHPAGLRHTLYVIATAWSDLAAYKTLTEMVARAGSTVVDLPEDGFDLTAYYRLARGLPEEWICFFNTYSVIEADGWLLHLADALARPGVGLAGCFGSYGTLKPHLRTVLFHTVEAAKTKHVKEVLRELLVHAKDYWRARQASERFPAFPNPHIRTNGFILPRDTYLAFWRGKAIPQTKLAVCAFKSGSAGLTRFIEARGQSVVVVGADGVYQKDKWVQSRTFRVPAHANNMISDNTTRRYLADSRAYRRKKEFGAWGRCFTA